MNIDPESAIELVSSPWVAVFLDLAGLAQEELLIASPYISGQPLEKVIHAVNNRHVHVSIITNLAIDSLLNGSLDVGTLLHVVETVPDSSVIYLPSLHAKVYIADTKAAIVTSANLTNRGLNGNHEYGVLIRDSLLVSKVKSDLTQYALLGNRVTVDALLALTQATKELKTLHQQAEKSIKAKFKAAFEEHAALTKIELLKARAKGKTTHGIFSDTILYLLEQKGPLKTIELHPLIQHIHPDLCDDSIDRVIDDVHFGKKWKHYVRNAQQSLKRQGKIDFDGQRWFRLD